MPSARRFVEKRLRCWHAHSLVEDATLLTSELAANAVRHSRARRICLGVRRLPDRVRVEVGDESPEPPLVGHPDPLASGGRGLQLVDALADRWGYDRRPGGEGKVVWFELTER